MVSQVSPAKETVVAMVPFIAEELRAMEVEDGEGGCGEEENGRLNFPTKAVLERGCSAVEHEMTRYRNCRLGETFVDPAVSSV